MINQWLDSNIKKTTGISIEAQVFALTIAPTEYIKAIQKETGALSETIVSQKAINPKTNPI